MTNYKVGYLQESLQRSKSQQKEYHMVNNIQLYIKDPVSEEIDIKQVLDYVVSSVPVHLMKEVDSIFIGMFEEFQKKSTNAMYKDGAIYVSNEQDDHMDMVDDIVHEIAHSLENPHGYILYADGKLEAEFMAKRHKLYDILKAENLDPDKSLFLNPDYTIELDKYLYEEVGYDRLNFIVSSYGLFTSAYSATALREYFANGFEYYFLDNESELREVCPELYKKIEELHHYED